MKFKLPNFLWGMMLLSVTILLQVSCISENSDPSHPVDPNAGLEKSIDEPAVDPFQNLRMDPNTLKMLADLRAAIAKYHDLADAEADGYSLGSACVSHPELGGMGFHYVNFPNVDGNYDPTHPEAILYEMDKNGQMKLVAVEFIVVTEAWEGEELPHFGSQIFDTALAPAPLPFDNYQLHVWIWKHNPAGIFTKFNPKVKCGDQSGGH